MKMSQLSRLSDRYLAALRKLFEQDPQTALPGAHELGSLTVALGLETLDLARIHDLALAALMPPGCSAAVRKSMTARAVLFFTEAIVPIEETHRIALEAGADLKRLHATLNERTQALTDAKRELRQGITARKTAEAVLATSERAFDQLLKESRLLEKNLQDMTRKILAANEEGRKKMSLQLQDEIVQTLLGIHVKLLSFEQKAAAWHLGLTQETATTQRLVEASVETIN
jgi:signal transduction histidine kinase